MSVNERYKSSNPKARWGGSGEKKGKILALLS